MVASFFKLLTTLFLALAVAAHPTEVVQRSTLVNVPLFKRVNTGSNNLVKHDQLRVESLKANAEGSKVSESRKRINSPATNQAVSYVASVGVGSPATDYDLIVDIGSSNTWVGANKAYVVTSTSQKTSDSVSVTYGSGSFSGTEYIDQVTIANGLVIPHQSIGVASTSFGFSGVDGIIGIGPDDLTKNTLSADTSSTIPTVTDNLFSNGTIPKHLVSVSFEPITDSSGQETNGELTWGGVDSSRYTGDITYTPITGTFPASDYWGIDASLSYGTTSILSLTAGIVDTGTTLVLIASDAFSRYQSATGAVLDSATGLLKLTSSQYTNLKSLDVTVSGVKFEFTANAQIWPRSLNTGIGGTAGSIYLIVGNFGSPSGSGVDFILGQTFLERFYSVYDTANKVVGLAKTSYTTSTSN